jgi:PAS domain S-box-containing protein
LKDSEEKFRQLAENIEQVFWLRTHDKFEYVSPAYDKIWGRPREKLYENPDESENCVYPDDYNRIKYAYSSEEYLNEGRLNVEYRIVKPDGSVRWVSARSFPVYDDNKNIVRIAGISEDITEEKNASEEIRKLVEQLIDANEEIELMLDQKNELVRDLEVSKMKLEEINVSKDKFFSIIAHDLRSPFSGFLGLMKILAEGVDNLSLAEIKNIVNNLLLAANNLYKLIENLLEWSRLQRDIIVPELFNIKLLNSIRECIDYISYSSDVKEITIKYDISDDIIVFVDMNLFDTIFRNLISNAIKFTNRGGEISITAKELDNNLVEINVKDNGIGMSSELISKLFKITEKVATKGTEGESSTGLGLLLCKEYIEMLGGTIKVESQEGVGSTFSFTIPIGTKIEYSFSNNTI